MPKITRKQLAGLTLLLLLLAGCSLFRSGEPETPAPPTATLRPTAIGTPPGTSPPDTPTPVSAEGDPTRLVLWASEDYAPTSETEGGIELLKQIQAFHQTHDARVEVILKKRSGPGGLLDFLTTASVAAPSVLPDLVTLSDADLYRATQAGLLQPLNELVPPELLESQFEFARALTQFEGTTVGVLYQADLHHLVYDTTALATPPLTWSDLYSETTNSETTNSETASSDTSNTASFVFSPAAPSDGVNDVILIQYLALGGQLTDADGQPALDADVLAEALTFFQRGLDLQVIPRSTQDLSDATTAWATYRIGEAGVVEVPASIYLAERAELSNAGFGPVPLREPGVTTIGHGWALAIVTQDPERQQLAVAFIEHLLSAQNSGTWTQTTGRLPTHPAAFEAWPPDDPYVPFIRNLLTQARPAPNPQVSAAVGGPLAEALAQVLSGRATPGEAAEAAALIVEQSR